MIENVSINIIPAQPGYRIVYEDEDNKRFYIGEHIIAWRVETFKTHNFADSYISSCTPLTLMGDPSDNYFGVQNPDKSISTFDADYDSLSDLQNNRPRMK